MTTLLALADLTSALPDIPSASLIALPAGITAAVERRCGQPLALRSRDEEYQPGTTREIRLKARYVQSVDRVLTDLVTAFTVQHAAGPWRANVSLVIAGDNVASTPTGLTLSSVTAGVTTTTTILFADISPTVQDLANAVNAVSGWTAVVFPGMGPCPTSEVRPSRSNLAALAFPAAIQAYSNTLAQYELDAWLGKITLYQVRPDGYSYPDRTWGPVGQASLVRVLYEAGFNGDAANGPVTTPPDLVEACVQCARATLDCREYSGVLQSENLGNTTYQTGDRVTIPDSAMGLLSPYIDRRF